MLRSKWTHKILVLFNAVVFGFITDRITMFPLWGLAAALLLLLAGWLKLAFPFVIERGLGLDSETAALMRSVILSVLFFLQCAVMAQLILAVQW